jgi:bifunctional non-homologous end joining protein LigD
MGDRLDEYRRKRDPDRTPEPVPDGHRAPPTAPRPASGSIDAPPDGAPADVATFVIQQHHARRLHWDLRLERDGVLVSWAVPRGIPRDPARNHLAVHTEDHPMEYATFSGEIPAGEYGGGRMTIYDSGTYTTEKWRDDEVIIELRGDRVSGRYVLFQTAGKDWMIHRMDPYPAGWTPMPEGVRPMRATPSARLPTDSDAWAYEVRWTGVRVLAAVSGGRLALHGADGAQPPGSYPELRAMAEALAPTECLLDGVLVAFDPAGRISAEALARRQGAGDSTAARRLAARTPVQLLAVDLLWLDGCPLLDTPYARRRELLAGLDLAGPNWQTPPHFPGAGPEVRQASREQGMPGVIAKRLDAPYLPGRRSRDWREIPHR